MTFEVDKSVRSWSLWWPLIRAYRLFEEPCSALSFDEGGIFRTRYERHRAKQHPRAEPSLCILVR